MGSVPRRSQTAASVMAGSFGSDAGNTSDLLRDAQYLVDGGDAGGYLVPAVFAERGHAFAARDAGQHACVFVLHDGAAKFVAQLHHLEDAHAALVAGTEAVFA